MLRNLTILAVVSAGMLAGCSSSAPAKPDPRDKGLSDPMNYNPAGKDRTDISGGGLLDFDKKAFQRDMNDVLSP